MSAVRLSSWLTIRDERDHLSAVAARRQTKGEQPGGSACLRRGRVRQVGDGRNKSQFLLCRGNAAYVAIRAEKASLL
mgnify:CR=1 FL=1